MYMNNLIIPIKQFISLSDAECQVIDLACYEFQT